MSTPDLIRERMARMLGCRAPEPGVAAIAVVNREARTFSMAAGGGGVVTGIIAGKRRRQSAGGGGGFGGGSGGGRGVFGSVSPVAGHVNGATWSSRLVRRAMARRLLPNLGGDGGLLGADESREHGNGRVNLTCAPAGTELHATVDPADRAHRVKVFDPKLGWQYLAAADSRGRPTPGLAATPRRYPRSSLMLSGAAFDSAFDETHARKLRLAGVKGIGSRSVMADLKYVPQRAASVMGALR